MNKIEVLLINPEAVWEAERMMVCAARLTQRGHTVQTGKDFMDLYNKDCSTFTVKTMAELPHPTIQKFAVINVAVVGASRRFLAQITRHQNEVKFMSASLQYSDYSDGAGFVVPYELLGTDKEIEYLAQCAASMRSYAEMVKSGVSNDTAGYVAPQSLRNALIISATPYQWKHMIGQRICRRNTDETRYVMLRIWEKLYAENPVLFDCPGCGPFCMKGRCKEGKMACGNPLSCMSSPTEILQTDFPKLCE